MPDEATLARASDALILSALLVYVLTLLVSAAEVALRRESRAVRQREPAMAGRAEGPPVDVAPEPPGGPSRGSRLAGVAFAVMVLATALLAAGVAVRGLAVGRLPLGNMYEFATAAALAMAVAFLAVRTRAPIRDVGPWVTALVVLALGLASTVLYAPAGDLVPALNSYWLAIHVTAATVAGGVFTIGAATMALLHVRQRKNTGAGGQPGSADDGTSSVNSVLARLTHGLHVFAFPIWTFAVLAGAIWAENAWGRYWGWDPKETWAFITWVLYAAYLHADATSGWWGRRAHLFAFAGYAAFVFNFFGVNMWITGLHSYAGV